MLRGGAGRCRCRRRFSLRRGRAVRGRGVPLSGRGGGGACTGEVGRAPPGGLPSHLAAVRRRAPSAPRPRRPASPRTGGAAAPREPTSAAGLREVGAGGGTRRGARPAWPPAGASGTLRASPGGGQSPVPHGDPSGAGRLPHTALRFARCPPEAPRRAPCGQRAGQGGSAAGGAGAERGQEVGCWRWAQGLLGTGSARCQVGNTPHGRPAKQHPGSPVRSLPPLSGKIEVSD